MENMPRPGEFYRHFKNKLYQVLAVAEHTETGERLVVYQALYGDFRIYARPLEMFLSPVDKEKYPNAGQERRFERIKLSPEGAEESLPDGRDGGQEEEGNFLMEFLDAETPEEKLIVLKKKGGQASARQLDMLCEVLEVPAGTDRISALETIRGYLEARIKYDGSRLRR